MCSWSAPSLGVIEHSLHCSLKRTSTAKFSFDVAVVVCLLHEPRWTSAILSTWRRASELPRLVHLSLLTKR